MLCRGASFWGSLGDGLILGGTFDLGIVSGLYILINPYILVFNRAVRHLVLKWARFVFRINIVLVSTSGLTLIDWCAVCMSSMSSGEERNVVE